MIGAGPAGLAAAIASAQNGASCLVVEEHSEIGYPICTSGASWIKEMLEFGIDKRLYHPVNRLDMYSPSGFCASADFDRPLACVLDVRGAYQFLASQAAREGAHILLRGQAVNVKLNNGTVSGVSVLHGKEKMNFEGHVIVDATGAISALCRKIGLSKPWTRLALGAEYDAVVPSLDPSRAILFVGSSVSPSGYGWIFPCGEDRARIGVAVTQPLSQENPIELLNNFITHHPIASATLKRIKPIEFHTGVFPCNGPLLKTVSNGFIAVGDAASQGSPLHGEGIRYAIQFGLMAGKTAAEAIRKDDSSEHQLRIYEKGWKAAQERNFRLGLYIQNRILQWNDAKWDRYVKVLADLKREAFVQILRTEFSRSFFYDVLLKHPRLFGKFLKARLRKFLDSY